MPTTSLRKVGGSVMLAVPPSILELLNLRVGSTVAVTVEEGRLVIEPRPRPRYALDELLAECDPPAETGSEDRGWLDDGPVGGELL